MCKIIPVLEKSREGGQFGGWGGSTGYGAVDQVREAEGTEGLHRLVTLLLLGAWGHQRCSLFLPREHGRLGLCSVMEQNLWDKCQMCGFHRMTAEARHRPDGQKDTSGPQQRCRDRRQTHGSFCCS